MAEFGFHGIGNERWHSMNGLKLACLAAAIGGGLAEAKAQSIVLDGVADASYGAPRVIQNSETGFGDSQAGLVDYAWGSELNAAYARISSGSLFLLLAGNLESNFNKLEIFIDAVPGGQNRLRGDNLDVDFSGLNRMGDDGFGTGLRFDKGFEADLWVSLTCGGALFGVYMNRATLPTGGSGTGGYVGTGGAGLAGAVQDMASQNPSAAGFGFGLDNSNTKGVAGGFGLGSGAGVSTGVEVRIPLSAIPGYTSGDLRICVFVNGQGHDYVSNQVLGGIGGGPNLEDPRFVNFAAIAGDQFFTVGAGSGGSCVGDLASNGFVDTEDLAILLAAWGTPASDLDGSGMTDGNDLTLLLAGWGECP
jgi:hypothetical protein